MHFREYRGDSGEVLFWGDWGSFGEEWEKMRDVLSFDKNVEMAQYGIYDREETGLEQQEYIWGDWIDSNGDVHPVRYKSKWGEHVFTDEEKRSCALGL